VSCVILLNTERGKKINLMRDVSIKLLIRAQRDTDRIDFYFELLQNLSVGLIVKLAGRDINCLKFHL